MNLSFRVNGWQLRFANKLMYYVAETFDDFLTELYETVAYSSTNDVCITNYNVRY